MRKLAVTVLPAVAATLSACGGDSSSGIDGVTTPTTTTPFFNDQAPLDFANAMGGKMNNLISPTLSVFTGTSATASFKRGVLATEMMTLNCQSGTASMQETTDDATFETTALSASFNNCSSGTETINGSISISGSGLAENADAGSVSLVIDNFTVSGTAPASVDGSVQLSVTVAGDETTATVQGPGLTMTSDGETISFTNYAMTVINNAATDAVSAQGTMTMASSIDGTITMSINPALETPDQSTNEYPVSGTIALTHSDGSSLTINADTGNPQTFSYVVNDGSATVSGSGNWDDTGWELD